MENSMEQITLNGNPVHINGKLPAVGTKAPAFTLTNKDLADVTLGTFTDKFIVLNIFPSVDTTVCPVSVRKFNAMADKLSETRVLCISADLPFAQARFCGAEGLEKVENLSNFRSPDFNENYGCLLTDSILKGLLTRCVVVLDENRNTIHTELVSEIGNEPNYKAVEAIIK